MNVAQLMSLFHRRLRFILKEYNVRKVDYNVSHGYLKLSVVMDDDTLSVQEKTNLEIRISRVFDDQDEKYITKVYNASEFYKPAANSLAVYKKGVGYFAANDST